MTSRELLKCLKDRPCDVCKFRDEHGCHRWTCVFEEPTPMTYEDKAEIVISQLREDRDRLLKAIDNIKAEITSKYDSIPFRYNDYDDGWIDGLEWALSVINKYVSAKENE